MIKYMDHLRAISPRDLKGFFVNWPNPPAPHKHYQILENSTYRIIAIDEETDKVVGFINALSDEVLYAYVPLLEVLPEYQNRGVGRQLVEKMLLKLKDYYAVDLCCDDNLENYYNKFGFFKAAGMIKRNYQKQNGA